MGGFSLRPAQRPSFSERLMEMLSQAFTGGPEAANDYYLRQAKDAEGFANEQDATKGAIGEMNPLDVPIAGANPEVPTLKDAMAGIIMGAGGLPLGSMAGGQTKDLSAPGRVYHGTRSEKPLRNRPGIHVGTGEQANTRAVMGSRPGRVEMFDFEPRKTAKMEDILHQKEFIGNKLEALSQFLSPAERESVYTSGHPRAKLNRLLRKKGYDAIEYENLFEGPGTSYEVLNLGRLKPPKPTKDLNIGKRFPPEKENAQIRAQMEVLERIDKARREEELQRLMSGTFDDVPAQDVSF